MTNDHYYYYLGISDLINQAVSEEVVVEEVDLEDIIELAKDLQDVMIDLMDALKSHHLVECKLGLVTIRMVLMSKF